MQANGKAKQMSNTQTITDAGALAEMGLADAGRAEANLAEPGFGDFVQLLKPRVMSLVIFTAFVGMVVAPVHLPPIASFTAILFIS